MLKTTFMIMGLCVMTLLGAQVPTVNFKYGLMLSNESSFARHPQQDFYVDGTLRRQYSLKTQDVIQAVPSFVWQTKKGNFMTVSIPNFRIRNQESTIKDSTGAVASGINSHQVEFAARYAYSIRFLKQKSQKWLPMLGFEATPYWKRHVELPMTTTNFAVVENYAGLYATLRPHVMWLPTEHLFLDAGVSYNLLDWYFGSRNNRDVTLPLESQQSSIMSYMGLPGQFGFQIGAGLRL